LDLTLVYGTFHGVIPGQSFSVNGRIDQEVLCGSGDNKHLEMLPFKVASFNIGYNYILGSPFLLKFMAVVHTAYTTIKMPSPKGVIIIKANQLDALACKNASLSHVGCFGNKATQEQVAKAAKTHSGSAPQKTSASKPLTSSTPQASVGTTSQKGINTTSVSALPPANQKVDNKKKGTSDDESNKEILADPNDLVSKQKTGPKFDFK
jgi:hypothetical protein